MTSNLSQFHFLASTVPAKFDFEADNFDVSHIYQHYSLKVTCLPHCLSFLLLCTVFLQHQRTPVSLFFDKMFASKLNEFAVDKVDYEALYVKTKELANVA